MFVKPATGSIVLYQHSHIVGVSQSSIASTAFCLCADLCPELLMDLDTLSLTIATTLLSLKVQNTFLWQVNYLKILFELAESIENVVRG